MNILNFFKKEHAICEVCPFILKYSAKSCKSTAYKRRYRNLAHKLQGYEKTIHTTLTSKNINYQMLEGFDNYLKDENLRKNSIRSIFNCLHFIIKKINQRGFEVNESTYDYNVKSEETTAVSLSLDEIKRIYEYNPRNRNVAIIKDLFVVGCLTGMRFSDYSRLTSLNISGNLITRKTRKTGAIVSVPIHHVVKEIIEKYGGAFPEYTDSAQNFNLRLKNICKRVGINNKILEEYTQGHKVVRKMVKKYELIRSHTARRSFATNAYLAGIPIARIMLMTGHKTEESFFRYIKIQKKENAILLSKHPFFAQ